MEMRRPGIRRTIVLLPNGFTLASLFLGVFAIVAASRGDYSRAGAYIVFAGIADGLDGRVARATRTESRFGAELDSLVDAIAFGLAPALIMYFAVLNQVGFDWVFCFLFTMCAVIRLARFNVEQAGRAKTHFNGLPSPAAGLTLATYYWFSQTPLYNQTFLASLPWHVVLRYLMVGLAFLMISNVKYPAVPTIGYRSVREVMGLLLIVGTIVGMLLLPWQFFFPALVAYVVWGVARTVFTGLLVRVPAGEDDDERGSSQDDDTEIVAADGAGPRRRRRRRRFRGARHSGPPVPKPPTSEEPRA
jgi:CDP-diacylglycerol---serine O-phosphatidyltransferase